MIENFDIQGTVHIKKNGELVGSFKNLVVQTGKDWVANRIRGAGATAITHIGIGTGTNSPASTDTTLITPYNARVAATVAQGSLASIVLVTTTTNISITSTVSITEAGTFTALSGGTMVSRVKFPQIDCVNGDTINIQWELKVG